MKCSTDSHISYKFSEHLSGVFVCIIKVILRHKESKADNELKQELDNFTLFAMILNTENQKIRIRTNFYQTLKTVQVAIVISYEDPNTESNKTYLLNI